MHAVSCMRGVRCVVCGVRCAAVWMRARVVTTEQATGPTRPLRVVLGCRLKHVGETIACRPASRTRADVPL